LKEEYRLKYFTSATEAEAIEGIIPYVNLTNNQKKLLKEEPELEMLDHNNIFGFFRNIDKSTQEDEKYISNDYDKAKIFKKAIKDVLPLKNILDVQTQQLSDVELNNEYILEFESKVISFLEAQVDEKISKEERDNTTSLEKDTLDQQLFLTKKVKNFIGQESSLKFIKEYIAHDNPEPLILIGKSGSGKSSILAKSIVEHETNKNTQVIYRFIGATLNSNTSQEVLTSILEELNIFAEEDSVKEVSSLSRNLEQEENNFVEFSKKVYEEIINFKDDAIIYIDGVDQLSNDDQFLWLPHHLPSNVKIILSAINDINYKEDTRYFNALREKSSNIYEVEGFDKPVELLNIILNQNNRTIQPKQKEYFLVQYEKVKTPFYVYSQS
jgi:hypothetical protein